MRRLLILLLLGGLSAPALSQESAELRPEDQVFLRLSVSPESVFVGEPVRLRFTIGYDRAFVKDHLVDLFSRRMDLQMQLKAPWLENIAEVLTEVDPRMLGLAPAKTAGESLSLALNDDVVEALCLPDRRFGEREFAVVAIERTYIPKQPGAIVLPAPALRLAWTSAFTPDFVNGRRPTDRHDFEIETQALRLEVLECPEEGRPPDFDGAVGRFEVSAEVGLDEVDVGEIFELTLTIEGAGNLGHFEVPGLGDLPGFHVYGSIAEATPGRLTVTYDLAATHGDLTSFPEIRFPYLDPGPPAVYRVARTAALPLVVHPGGPPEETPEPGAPETGPYVMWIPYLLIGGLLLFVALIITLVWWLTRAPRRDQPDPEGARILAAAREFEARLGGPDPDPAGAFTAYLSAVLGCPEAAVIAPGLGERLTAVGVPDDLAGRTATLMWAMVGKRYGGGGAAGDQADDLRGLVADLKYAFLEIHEAAAPPPPRRPMMRRWGVRLLVIAALTILLPLLLLRLPVGRRVTVKGEMRYQMLEPAGSPGSWLRSPVESLLGNRGLFLLDGQRFYVSRADFQRCWPESPHEMSNKGYTMEVTLEAHPLLLGGYTPATVTDVRRVPRPAVVSK